MSGRCVACGAPATAKCGQCRGPWYCSKEHQRDHWKNGHRDECGRAVAARQWAKGLSAHQQREWLVDCYRMRVDDDYCWGGCFLHGLYDPDHTPRSIVLDFLVFCKLAVARDALPPDWKWEPFLNVAAEELLYAFEKSDAQEKYGGENVFAAMTGGRSLRYTGEVIMGSSVTEEGQSQEAIRMDDRTRQLGRSLNGDNALFDDVGDVTLWRTLLTTIKAKKRNMLEKLDWSSRCSAVNKYQLPPARGHSTSQIWDR